MQIDTDQVIQNIGYDGNEDGYPNFITMTNVLNRYIKSHGFQANWHIGVSLDRIDQVLDGH